MRSRKQIFVCEIKFLYIRIIPIYTMPRKHTLYLLLLSLLSFAQQESQFTQYMFNTIVINPAYAGSRQMLSVFGQYRSQWLGMEGAPVSQAFSVNSPVGFSGFGAGISVLNERIGPVDDAQLNADVSYTVQTSTTWQLALGIKVSAQLFSFQAHRVRAFQPNDPSYQSITGNLQPNAGLGAFWYSSSSYIGISAPNVFEIQRYNDNDLQVYRERINYYLIGGHIFNLHEDWQLKPAFLLKNTSGAPLQADVSLNAQGYERFLGGVSWRNSGAWAALMGVQINKSIFLGYAYDSETTQLRNFNSGSHEFFIRFEMQARHQKIVSPRFF